MCVSRAAAHRRLPAPAGGHHPRRPTQALRLMSSPQQRQVRQPPSVATLAADVVHNMAGLFPAQ